jgi:hypothetical protein
LQLNLIPLVNFIIWIVIYSVAAFGLIRLFSLNVRNEGLTSGIAGLVSTIIDAAVTSSSQGPVTALSLLPMTVVGQSSAAPIAPYLGTLIIFVVVFGLVYLIRRDHRDP